MKYLFLIVSLLVTTVTFSQKKEKDLGSFSQIKAFDGLSIKLIKSDHYKAVITGKHANNVVFVNKGGLLKIRLDLERSYQGNDTYVSLYYKDLYLIDANEGAYIFSEETLKAIDLDVKAQEGAEIKLDVIAKRLNIRSVSGSTIAISGKANNQDITVNTGGIYKAKKLITEQANVSVNAGGTAKIYATDIVKATVKAGGNIRIYGNPRVVDEKKVLGGNITIVK